MIDDPAEVRLAFDQAVDSFVGSLMVLDTAALDRPATDRWRVIDLIGHVCAAIDRTRLDLVADPDERPVTFADTVEYYRSAFDAAGVHDFVAARAPEAVERLGPDPVPAAIQSLIDVKLFVADQPDDAVLDLRLGRMTLVPYLPSRVLELVVHGADLQLATGQQVHAPDLPLRLTLEVVTGLLDGPSAADALLALTGRRTLPDGFNALS